MNELGGFSVEYGMVYVNELLAPRGGARVVVSLSKSKLF